MIVKILLIFLLLSSICKGQELETYTYPSEPYILNELEVKLDPPEGWEVGDIKYYKLSGSVDGKLLNGMYVYTAGPKTTSKVLFVVAHKKCDENRVNIVAKIFLLTFQVDPGNPSDPTTDPNPSRKPVRVTYVYERLESVPTVMVKLALMKLNQDGIQATSIDKDSRTGSGQIPSQYAKAIPAAIDKGLPSLVVEFSDGSLVVISDPETEEDIKEALK